MEKDQVGLLIGSNAANKGAVGRARRVPSEGPRLGLELESLIAARTDEVDDRRVWRHLLQAVGRTAGAVQVAFGPGLRGHAGLLRIVYVASGAISRKVQVRVRFPPSA